MKLSDIDEITALRNHRKKWRLLSIAAQSSFMTLGFTEFPDPASMISLQCVRDAVVFECDQKLMDSAARLKELGVEVDDEE